MKKIKLYQFPLYKSIENDDEIKDEKGQKLKCIWRSETQGSGVFFYREMDFSLSYILKQLNIYISSMKCKEFLLVNLQERL